MQCWSKHTQKKGGKKFIPAVFPRVAKKILCMVKSDFPAEGAGERSDYLFSLPFASPEVEEYFAGKNLHVNVFFFMPTMKEASKLNVHVRYDEEGVD